MKKLAYIFLVPFLLLSCMKELDGGQELGRLDFRVSLESFKHTSTKAGEPVELKGGDVKMYLIPEVREWSAPVTKGSIVEDASSVEGFFLFGYRYDDNHEWTGIEEERNLFDAEYVSRRNGSFVMDHPKLWASSDSPKKQRFFAFVASQEGDLSGSSSLGSEESGHHLNYVDADSNNGSGIPSIYYQVACSEEVSSQEDILYALSPELKYTQGGNGVVDLAFSHALTAVKFSVEDFGVPAVIKRVSISNVYRDGVFEFDGAGFLWDTSSSSGSSSYTFSASLADDSDGVSVGRTGESELTGGEATFLMIPQECYSGSEVNIEFEHDGKMYSLYASLEGQVWEMGKEIEYKLSLTDGTYHLDVSSPEAFTQKGVAETIPELFNVKAYIQYAGGVKEALPWSVYGFSEDGGTTWTDVRPTWLTALTESGSGDYDSGDAVSGSVVADRDSYEALVRIQIDEHTSTYVDVLVEKQGDEPLTFTIVTGGDIVWKCSVESYSSTIKYKKNTDDWVEIESTLTGVSIPVEAGDVLKFKGVSWNNSDANPTSQYSFFSSSSGCSFNASGSVMSLIPSGRLLYTTLACLFKNCVGLLTAPELPATSLWRYCYFGMFDGCTGLISSPVLPATTLEKNCYQQMFQRCTGLTSAPELPATTLAESCYYYMFAGCTSLTSAPELPATMLAQTCYFSMFSGCTGLTSAPELPATTLAQHCYNCMFLGCTGLTSAPELPATILASSCYHQMFYGCTGLTSAPELPATTLAESCYESMFRGCTSLVESPKILSMSLASKCCYRMFMDCTSLLNSPELFAPSLAPSCYKEMFRGCISLAVVNVLPATTLAESCYESMFSGCTSLTSAPELPATTLATSCYDRMFSGCTSLTSVSELPATTLATSCYNSMFYGCTSLTVAPELSATVLSNRCYLSMFSHCKSLTSAPELPATTLATQCYYQMFYGCTGLTAVPELPATTLAQSCYYSMFYGCTGLTSAPELPATTLAESCYYQMFMGCTGLTEAPALPATALAGNCYENMFYGCTGLTKTPELLATTLASNCYRGMFSNCTSLASAPELPASTLAESCYQYMFSGCTSLAVAPELPATTLAESCYQCMFGDCYGLTSAPNLPALTLATSCYREMFQNCTSLTETPELPASSLAPYCYESMFRYCYRLTDSPFLPATILASGCYRYMFYSCSRLSSLTCLATDISAINSLTSWLSGAGTNVSGTKTFYKNPAMSDWPVGDSGIPSGWTIVDATL